MAYDGSTQAWIGDRLAASHEEFVSEMVGHPKMAALGIEHPGDPGTVAEVAPLVARVYQDAWIVDCPDCGGAEFYWRDSPRMFCLSCGNAAVGGKWRPATLPDEAAQIERVLDKRPLRASRNWTPWETVAELEAENIIHGINNPVTKRGDPH